MLVRARTLRQNRGSSISSNIYCHDDAHELAEEVGGLFADAESGKGKNVDAKR
jgi:hypothetical protein